MSGKAVKRFVKIFGISSKAEGDAGVVRIQSGVKPRRKKLKGRSR